MDYELKFLIALAETITIETVGLYLFFFLVWRKAAIRPTVFQVLTAGILTTGSTLPYLWFVLPAFWSGNLYIWGGEILVAVAECLILKRILPIPFWKALIASVSVNLLSVLVGYYWL